MNIFKCGRIWDITNYYSLHTDRISDHLKQWLSTYGLWATADRNVPELWMFNVGDTSFRLFYYRIKR